MPNTSNAIPLRQFGRHNVKISAIGFGGHHLGDAPDESTAVRLVRQAVDGRRFKGSARSRVPDDQGLYAWARQGAGVAHARRIAASAANRSSGPLADP